MYAIHPCAIRHTVHAKRYDTFSHTHARTHTHDTSVRIRFGYFVCNDTSLIPKICIRNSAILILVESGMKEMAD